MPLPPQVLSFLRLMWLLTAIIIIDLLGAGQGLADGPVKVVSADLDAAPYIRTDGVTFIDGIIKDLNDEVARRLGIEVVYAVLGRRSLDDALLSGEGHVVCNLQPAWTTIADELVWTEPMFEDSDVYWRLADTPEITDVGDLAGKSFMTYAGYTHSDEVMAQVAAGSTRRVDLYTSQSLFDALIRRGADYGIFSQIRGRYLSHDPKYKGKIVATALVDTTYRNFCALSPEFPGDIDAYKKALDDIARDGTLAEIVKKYE